MTTGLLQAFAGFNSFLSLSTAFVSDLVSAQHRASTIGLIMAAFSVGLLFGPLLGGFLGTVVASALSVVGTSLALLLLIFTVPESLSQASKEGVSSVLLCPSLLKSFLANSSNTRPPSCQFRGLCCLDPMCGTVYGWHL